MWSFKMEIDEAIKIIQKECSNFTKKLVSKGVPIEDYDFDLDDLDMGEPFIHLHINLDNDWFYKKIKERK